jgi:ketosteroid isomerase-like protein
MTIAEEKERALAFLRALEQGRPEAFDDLIRDDFELEIMTRLPGVGGVTQGKPAFKTLVSEISKFFPRGLNFTFGTAIAEDEHVAVQAESNAVAANGRKYANRYHFYFRFIGDKIALAREYNDSNHVREVMAP